MGKRVWAAFVAGGILVGAGLLTALLSAPEVASAQDESDKTQPTGRMSRVIGMLGEVLGDLVDDGKISQAQSNAILDAAKDKATQLREEHRSDLEQLDGLLDDGVITEEEASTLSDDHFLFGDRFDDAWADGQLTTDELRGVLHHFRRDIFRRGLRLGSLLDDGGIDRQEYNALPDRNPLKQADVSDYLSDGLITRDEIGEILADIWADHTDATTNETSA